MATHYRMLAWRIPMDRGAWQALVHRMAEIRTRLSGQAQHNFTADETSDRRWVLAWVILETECVFPTLPPQSYAEALKPLVLGNAAFGRSGLNEVMRVGSQDGISALVCNKRNCPESSRQEPSWTEEKPHELTRRRRYLRWESQLSLDPESEAPRFQTLQTPEV